MKKGKKNNDISHYYQYISEKCVVLNEWGKDMKQIIFREGRLEKIEYKKEEFPVYVGEGNISDWFNYCVSGHWHDELELIIVKKGSMMYRVNDEEFELSKGQGVIVNARQLHSNFSPLHKECTYICILIHPMLLCPSKYIEEKYIKPVIGNQSFIYCRLDEDAEWKKQIMDLGKTLQNKCSEDFSELEILRSFYAIWELLYHNLASKDGKFSQVSQLSEIKAMMEYIQEHHKQKITLDDIAAVGGMGKTYCTKLFRRYLNKSPIEYVIEYRLQKGAELLVNSNLNITEICFETGFSSSSYFAEQFHERMGCSPREYRRKFVKDKDE